MTRAARLTSQVSGGHYFHFTLDASTTVTIKLSAGLPYASKARFGMAGARFPAPSAAVRRAATSATRRTEAPRRHAGERRQHRHAGTGDQSDLHG